MRAGERLAEGLAHYLGRVDVDYALLIRSFEIDRAVFNALFFVLLSLDAAVLCGVRLVAVSSSRGFFNRLGIGNFEGSAGRTLLGQCLRLFR